MSVKTLTVNGTALPAPAEGETILDIAAREAGIS